MSSPTSLQVLSALAALKQKKKKIKPDIYLKELLLLKSELDNSLANPNYDLQKAERLKLLLTIIR